MAEEQTGIRIRDYRSSNGGFVDQSKLAKIMFCLEALVSEADDVQIGDKKTLSPQAILELRYHSFNPRLTIDGELFDPVKDTLLSQLINGNQESMGDFLFGQKWRDKIKNSEPLSIPDPDIRAVICAAQPKVKVRYYSPVDMSHSLSQERFLKLAELERTKQYAQDFIQPESGEAASPHPRFPGELWCDRAEKLKPPQTRGLSVA